MKPEQSNNNNNICMKMCWLLLYKEVKVSVIQYIHVNLLAPTMERYSHIFLILQRDVLALCSGEAKARYNIVQAFFKIVLVEAWLTKSPYNEL